MKLKIENIGMIRQADIRLDGLTIIAGENDTGKSTVGKLIFSLVKAFNRYEKDLQEGKLSDIYAAIEKNYFQLRKEYDFEKNVQLRDAFYPSLFFIELTQNQATQFFSIIDDRIVLLKEMGALKYVENINAIREIYLDSKQAKSLISMALITTLISEFDYEFSQKNLASTINISEGENKISDISIKNNKVEFLELYDDFFFNDATFVETPIFLQMSELINSAPTFFEMTKPISDPLFRPSVALHAKDLVSKLKNAQYFSFQNDNLINSLLNDIQRITNGSGFSFEKGEGDFYFNKNESTKFKSINTATGLKSFGIIQLLIQAEILNERSLLIIDEPEIHLHPKWQVEYAKLIVSLVKNDIPVLLTSHSPEIIQALNVFSEKFGIQDRTAYYLTESDGVSSEIKDVTDNINKIFIKLTEPLHDLVSGI